MTWSITAVASSWLTEGGASLCLPSAPHCEMIAIVARDQIIASGSGMYRSLLGPDRDSSRV